MSRTDILANFLRMFPYYQELICSFESTGPNSITATMKDGEEVDFTYFDDDDWRVKSKW